MPRLKFPLRGGKGMLYEGGIRAPLLVRWPGVMPAGGVCREPAATIDLYPTFLDIAGLQAPDDHSLDGVSLVPVLRNPRSALDREAIYFHFPHYHAGPPAGAVRAGVWKLIEFFVDGHRELYNLDDDLGEKENLAERKPDQTHRMHQKLQQWRAASRSV